MSVRKQLAAECLAIFAKNTILNICPCSEYIYIYIYIYISLAIALVAFSEQEKKRREREGRVNYENLMKILTEE